MAEPSRRRSPLAHRGLAARAAAVPEGADAGVILCEHPFRGQVVLRGDVGDARFRDAVGTIIGVAPPVAPNTVADAGDPATGGRILWLGPDEWLVVTAAETEPPADRLRTGLAGLHAAVVDVSDGRTVIALSGHDARHVLAKGCPLDLHPRVFQPGRCAQSLLAKAHVLLHQTDDTPTYELYVHASFADYLWAWLEDAGAEYGVAIGAGGE